MTKEIIGDITKLNVDVIINAANTSLVHGGGIARAIFFAAGIKLKEKSDKIGHTPIGKFAVTSGGDMSVKNIIHIPTMDYMKTEIITYEKLETVFRDVLNYCRDNNLKTIATPLLATRTVGLDEEKVKCILHKVGNEFKELEVIIVNFGK